MSLSLAIAGKVLTMILKEIKEDLISEAELIIYQMKAAQMTADFGTVNDKANTLNEICKKLEFVRQEEEKLYQEFDF